MKLRKIIFALFTIIYSLSSAQSSNLYPRTLNVKSKGTLEVEPDEINCSFQINVESKKSKGVKMPLLKMEDQLKLQLQKLNIPATKLDISSDPLECGATFKACKLNRMTYDEFIKIKSYFAKNIFIDKISFSYKITKPESIKKYSEQLLKIAFEKNRKKADGLAIAMGEQIYGIQIVNNADFLEEYKSQLENEIDFFENYTKTELSSEVDIDYDLDPINSNSILPQRIRVFGKGEKIVSYQNVIFRFDFKMEDYEDGDPKAHFEKVKSQLNSKLISLGVPQDKINTIADEYQQFEFFYNVPVKGDKKIKEIYNYLLTNKNVTELVVDNIANSDDSAYVVYEKELITNAVQNAKDKLTIIEKITGLKSVKVFDAYLVEVSEGSDEAYEVVEAAATNSRNSYGIDIPTFASKVDNLEAKITRSVSIRYQVK